MMVNGIPRWTCRTHVKKVLTRNALSIAPLRNLPVIKDLAANMDAFFDKWTMAGGQFQPTRSRTQTIAPIDPNSVKRREADLGIECINCAVCYAACDVVTRQPAYLGPAALNRAWTLMNDVRDGAHRERLRSVSETNGCHNCHSQQGCTQYCPNALNPTRSIAGLKRLASRAIFSGTMDK